MPSIRRLLLATLIAIAGASLVSILDHQDHWSDISVVGGILLTLVVASLVGIWPLFRKPQ